MLKRIFNLSSPLGIALTAAGLILAVSPQARRATRQLLVKGTSLMLGTVESIKATAGVTVNMADATPAIADASDCKDDAHEDHARIGGMLGHAAENIMDAAGRIGDKVQAGVGGLVDSVTGDHRPDTH